MQKLSLKIGHENTQIICSHNRSRGLFLGCVSLSANPQTSISRWPDLHPTSSLSSEVAL